MVLEKLESSLKNTLKKLTGATFINEKIIAELVKDIQRALLQSDVNVKLVFSVTKKIKERALKEKAPNTISNKEHIINIVYEELVEFLGGESKGFEVSKSKKPFKIMLVGLFGNGKTTTAGKLGKYFKKRNFKVALISTDTWRPAATDQLSQLGKQIGVDVFTDKKGKNPSKIYKSFEKKLDDYDVVVIDTAGRDALNDELIEELNSINKAVGADETLLVMAADIGQAAEAQARVFNETCDVTGVIITKLDGTAKGGGALIACSVTNAKVRFIGVGEKIDDFEEFKPKGFVGRILGMGDLEALIEKTKEAISEEDAEKLGKKFLKGEFNLLDMYEQMAAMKKMGPLNKVMKMIPGLGGMNIPKDMLKQQESKLEIWKHLMNSMTKKELEEPELIRSDRLERIAKGSGHSISELRSLLKQYKQSKKMMKLMKGGSADEKGMQKMMAKMAKNKKMMKGMKF